MFASKTAVAYFFLTNIKSVHVEIWEWLRESTIENMDFGNENILILSHKISMLKFMNGNNYCFDATKLTNTRKQIKLI